MKDTNVELISKIKSNEVRHTQTIKFPYVVVSVGQYYNEEPFIAFRQLSSAGYFRKSLDPFSLVCVNIDQTHSLSDHVENKVR